MKTLIFALFLATTAAAPQEMGIEVFNAENDCLPKFPSISREYLENLKRSRELPENPSDEFKCFLACIGKTLQVMSHEGKLHFENLKNVTVSLTGGDASHDDAHAMVSKCIDVEHDDSCEKAWQYVLCKISELMPYKFAKGFCPTCSS